MKRIVRLTESDLVRLVKKVISEQDLSEKLNFEDYYKEILPQLILKIQPKINSVLGTDQFVLLPVVKNGNISFNVLNKKHPMKNRREAFGDNTYKINSEYPLSNAVKFTKWLERQAIYVESLFSDTDRLYFPKLNKLEDGWLERPWLEGVDEFISSTDWFDKAKKYQK
jgi:hypothetical protein